ncbi:MAG: hypothetical protein N2053_03680 [Chitinispirillaceae bacterium]|nr:hypothetical protein [Chitinispirillaceae bacterium]
MKKILKNVSIIKQFSFVIFFVLSYGFNFKLFSSHHPSEEHTPDIGLTLDAITDVNNAKGRWLSSGLTIRSTEIIAKGDIDPYAYLMTNVLLSQKGVELHEAFAEFYSLPLNLKLKGGLMLANFGRWNRFHTHSMPFISEPRIYKEYVNGMLALKGIELYFLAPLSNYLELSLGLYNLIEGHTHDFDPPYNISEFTPEEIAEMIGAIAHGSHYDYNGVHLENVGDLYNIAGLPAPNDPEIYRGIRGPMDFAYGGRIVTRFDLGSENSIDIGTSLLYQAKWKESKRLDYGFPLFYDKFLGGMDIVFFWNSLNQTKYRNLQAGIEFLLTKEYWEKIFPTTHLIESFRGGGFVWINYQHNSNLQIGSFGSIFQSCHSYNNNFNGGVYLTFSITHYQHIRLEYSFFNYPQLLNKVSRILIQYNGSIGHHSHKEEK